MKKITLSADNAVVEAARARARAENTTLEEQFGLWIADYAHGGRQVAEAMAQIRDLRGRLRIGGRKLTREEMNERWPARGCADTTPDHSQSERPKAITISG